MAGASFDTDRMACFVARRTELYAALPDWRVPLPAAVEREGKNPFTGTPLIVKTRDPGPDGPVTIPPTLPFEHALLPNEEDWEIRYLALDLILAGDDSPVPVFGDFEALFAIMAARGLDDEPLLGGAWPYDPRWVHVVPQRLITGLNALREDSLHEILASWNCGHPARARWTTYATCGRWLTGPPCNSERCSSGSTPHRTVVRVTGRTESERCGGRLPEIPSVVGAANARACLLELIGARQLLRPHVKHARLRDGSRAGSPPRALLARGGA